MTEPHHHCILLGEGVLSDYSYQLKLKVMGETLEAKMTHGEQVVLAGLLNRVVISADEELPMTNTQECKAQAAWRQIGANFYKLPKFVYRLPCHPGNRMVEHLGAVKKRSDGRWNWWRFRSDFHRSWHENFGGGVSQGVADNQAAAEVRVLEGWDG